MLIAATWIYYLTYIGGSSKEETSRNDIPLFTELYCTVLNCTALSVRNVNKVFASDLCIHFLQKLKYTRFRRGP